MAYKNKYIPVNPNKYIGDSNKIICRSLWERKFCKYLDGNKLITKWGFECISIPYMSPIDNKKHMYIPDFIVESSISGNKSITLIEIKPKKQTKDPKTRKRINLKEAITYSINEAKWKSAKVMCESNGWQFKILTEEELF